MPGALSNFRKTTIAEGPWYAHSRGAQVVLRYRDKDMAFKEMPFVYLLPHEKRLAEVICKSLAALWPELISITLWGNQDMDPGSLMISRDRNFGLEPNVAGKEMVEKSEETVNDDLSRSNGEKEGERALAQAVGEQAQQDDEQRRVAHPLQPPGQRGHEH